MSYITRIVLAFNPDGSHKGSAVYDAEVIGGKVFDLEPRAITAADSAALAAVLKPAHTSALAAVQTLTAERDAAREQVATLQAQLAPPPALVPAGELILRFTAGEFQNIRELSETDQVVAGFIDRTKQPEPINVASPAFAAALQYLVAQGCITADRIPALSAAPQ